MHMLQDDARPCLAVTLGKFLELSDEILLVFPCGIVEGSRVIFGHVAPAGTIPRLVNALRTVSLT